MHHEDNVNLYIVELAYGEQHCLVLYDCHLTLLRKPSGLNDEWLLASTISWFQPRILLYLHAALQPIVRFCDDRGITLTAYASPEVV